MALRRLGLLALAGALAATATWGRASAADLDDDWLRGSFSDNAPPVRWDGIYFGLLAGYSNLNINFSGASNDVTLPGSNTTNSASYGGFIGYNVQWDDVILGIDGSYNRPTSLESTVTATDAGITATATSKLVDYGTVRLRGGYAFGQFLAYGVLGGAVGRFNYSIVESTGSNQSRDNAYAAGIVGGLGLDVQITPNIFVRGEWDYIAFSPIAGISSQMNTARVGLGVRF